MAPPTAPLALPATPEGADEAAFAAFRHEAFVTRARAVGWARLAFVAAGVAVFSVPSWSEALGAPWPEGLPVVGAMLAYGAAAQLLAPGRHGRWANYAALVLDTAVLVHLVSASGGLTSPLLATAVLLAPVCAALFPHPLAIAPALFALPLVARLDLAARPEEAGLDLVVLLWYAALEVAAAAVVVLLHRRDVAHGRAIVGLEARLRDLAVVEERNRLAREVHDGLGAALAGLSMQAECLEGRADGALRDDVAELRTAALECLEELRRSLRLFRGEFDLGRAAEEHVRAVESRSRLPVGLDVAGRFDDLAGDRALGAFRVLQESLGNVVRHAGARTARVMLARDGAGVRLEVADDGRGFDPRVPVEGHYGLLGLRERARRLGGTIEIETGAGGTAVRFRMPTSDEGEER